MTEFLTYIEVAKVTQFGQEIVLKKDIIIIIKKRTQIFECFGNKIDKEILISNSKCHAIIT